MSLEEKDRAQAESQREKIVSGKLWAVPVSYCLFYLVDVFFWTWLIQLPNYFLVKRICHSSL